MTDYSILQYERDGELITEFLGACKNLRRGFEEWIQAELKTCLVRLECLEPTLSGVLKLEAQDKVRRMRDMNQVELPEAVRNIDQKMAEIKSGSYSDVRDARRFLEEGMSRFDMMVTELMSVRKFLESYEGDDDLNDNADDEESD